MLVSYDRSLLRHDALSGLVVALVLIPSAFAYADLAKCAPAAGIYAAIGGMVVFAMFTSSRHVIVGPDAAIALLVGTTVGPLVAGEPGKAVTLATVLAFLTAGVLLLMARLRLGIAADYLSSPAMLGFMNGAAVVIVGSQIGKLFGIKLNEDNTLLSFWEWIRRLGETHMRTLAIGLACLAVTGALPLENAARARSGSCLCAGDDRRAVRELLWAGTACHRRGRSSYSRCGATWSSNC